MVEKIQTEEEQSAFVAAIASTAVKEPIQQAEAVFGALNQIEDWEGIVVNPIGFVEESERPSIKDVITRFIADVSNNRIHIEFGSTQDRGDFFGDDGIGGKLLYVDVHKLDKPEGIAKRLLSLFYNNVSGYHYQFPKPPSNTGGLALGTLTSK